MNIVNEWKDYEILDMANEQKLERWGNIILIRPDPQIIWKEKSYSVKWDKADAIYIRSKNGGGSWEYRKKVPSSWQIQYKNLTFNIKPMGFKHTGLFPEQAVNWDWMMEKIEHRGRFTLFTTNPEFVCIHRWSYYGMFICRSISMSCG